jgi:protocatechuate 3,4-dioxygenase beta subunit
MEAPTERFNTESSRVVLLDDDDDDGGSIFDRGLSFDLATIIDRRQALKLLGFTGVSGLLVACGPGGLGSASPTSTSTSSSSSSSATSGAACADPIPEETAGPYPGDGSNGPDVLNQSGVVRSDIRSSFGGASGTAEGVPLTIKLAIEDQDDSCAPLPGAAVYLWHCDRDGNYSLYSQAAQDQNYLRGVQAADSHGVVTFTSIFPACYSGRWPHVHFEVYPSLDKATDQGNKIATSQIALPKDTCDTVYATEGYSQSVSNLSRVSLTSDNVFGDDGGARQLGSVSGSVDQGYVVELAVPVSTT